MRIRANTEYAMQTVMHLAVAEPETTTTREMSAQCAIPLQSLAQVVTQLRRAGVIVNSGDGAGRYQLAVPPDLLSVVDVMRAVDHGDDGHVTVARTSPEPKLAHLWQALSVEIHDFLDGVTVADLVDGRLPSWAQQLAARSESRR